MTHIHQKQYFAHSIKNQPDTCWQPLSEHLHNVANLAAHYASSFGAGDIAYYCGLLHDLGKYSEKFDKRIRGWNGHVNHSTAGAKIAISNWGILGKLMAYCIAGHHGGLMNGNGTGKKRSTLEQRLKETIEPLDEIWKSEIKIQKNISLPSLKLNSIADGFTYAFFIRMLYSCLVDADYLDTEKFYNQAEGIKSVRGDTPSLTSLQEQFNQYILRLRANVENSQLPINELRNEIFSHALEIAKEEPGLFSLTVPTGGGKTLTSMGFALEHAKKYHKTRIIYVIPYTSIIEQNAEVFRQAFGALGKEAVLEHHSAFDVSKFIEKESKDKLRKDSENWDRPIVVTTAVQFFESLFADNSSQCRKLHNIANSVIILDEAQMIPLHLLRPIMAAIEELVNNYQCGVVLCTATQPAIQKEHGFYQGFSNVREIAPNPSSLFEKLERVSIKYIPEKQNDDALTQALQENEQILIILNNRKHAKNLYDSLQTPEDCFVLTTLMCAKHRSKTLAIIKDRLNQGLPCRVISTSLIEAGVDVDFPLVMREESGLDSIAQSAGRCNREGKRKASDSCVLVFQGDLAKWPTPLEMIRASECMRSVRRNFSGNLLSQEALISYYRELYALYQLENLDKHNILHKHQKAKSTADFPFQDIASDFQMIQDYKLPIIIPFDDHARKLINELRYIDRVGDRLRQLQPYIVQVSPNMLRNLIEHERVEAINAEKFGNQFYVLIEPDLYDSNSGFFNI